ncbi:proton myo-inositol cotransporter-like [Mizuhopecten yessoensis]|uniref:Proton myo-inositol cotransporter n=1 Tax=Mizuhopecten yessoensis TaxID=6573 RepID=A0A210PS43_MIZYE|nr:proton myo-inositol cotransporter-like [Mizuhopecten yessoensis]OWF39315.1 Proton myo-inositol cotransporter [Mizuhopecten yessoensis]
MSIKSNGSTNGGRPRSLYEEPEEERHELKLDSIVSKPRTPTFVYVLTFFSALGGFLFGYDTGVISGAMILLRNEFNLSSVWQELIVSVTVAAAAVFALIGGYLNDRLGRRPVIMAASIVFTIGAVCMAIAGDKYLLLAGRVIIGAGIGMTSTTIPMYLAECSPAHIRGRLVSTNIAMVACGQFVANVIDGIFGWDETTGWRYMLGLAGIPSFVQFLGFIMMPESPRWLIINHKDERARRVLQTMRGQLDIEEEYDSVKNSCMETEVEEQKRSKMPIIIQMIQTPSIRRALIVGCSLQMFQQVAGINTVMYYSATIIRMSGVKGDETAIWLSAVTSFVNFMFTILGLYLVEKIGRRALTLGSLIGAVISLAWLAIGFHLSAIYTPPVTNIESISASSPCSTLSTCNQCMRALECGYCYLDNIRGPTNSSCLPTDYEDPWQSTIGRCNTTSLSGNLTWAYDYCPTDYSWMPMAGLVLYLIFFAPGMGPMPWTINSEIYPLWARSTGNAASTFTNWIFNLAVSMSFISLTETLTRQGTFCLYAGMALIGVVTLGFLLPETKGKSLEEVEGLFAQPWCSGRQTISYNTKTIQYVHIRGLNRDGRESELDSPE